MGLLQTTSCILTNTSQWKPRTAWRACTHIHIHIHIHVHTYMHQHAPAYFDQSESSLQIRWYLIRSWLSKKPFCWPGAIPDVSYCCVCGRSQESVCLCSCWRNRCLNRRLNWLSWQNGLGLCWLQGLLPPPPSIFISLMCADLLPGAIVCRFEVKKVLRIPTCV
jgi:hypothetical protein